MCIIKIGNERTEMYVTNKLDKHYIADQSKM